ncbi:hypothetical protein SIAM614_13488 [Stappia aggregata IAM 12614]|uniref:Sugar ABC transporter permease n=1 Tax=Roseibium aggregatum (strain ATCC 25650 / DSM 13394 / JCM 20685 / NBRC 16684 / NCIMB 2208 / IAM 12614 / B1) TaxID=384765 RepID=A0NQH3_ROSAI|nr:sugar ABC transporter permease [Roseibium aggregatum]EAV45031.1 hypothetical protein SIAM614_13488 [Stappia aggregata IAM 12614] [Roseibium aggregatum IAM 12614]
MAQSSKKTDYFPFLPLVPGSLVMLAIVAYPLFEPFRLSFTNTSMSSNYEYVGLENYEKLMSRGSRMVRAVAPTHS